MWRLRSCTIYHMQTIDAETPRINSSCVVTAYCTELSETRPEFSLPPSTDQWENPHEATGAH